MGMRRFFGSTFGSGGFDFTGVLDGIESYTAYSINRSLYTAYTGPLIQIDVELGGSETDVPLKSDGTIDLDFIEQYSVDTIGINPAGRIFISKIYDQSGNNNHTDVPADTNRARIYDGTSFNLVNTKLCGDCVNTRTGQAVSYIFTSVDLSNKYIFAVANSLSTTSQVIVGNSGINVQFVLNDANQVFANGSPNNLGIPGIIITPETYNSLGVMQLLFNSGTNASVYWNNNFSDTKTTTNTTFPMNNIGKRQASQAFRGNFAEIVFLNPADFTRSTLIDSVKSYYGIT